MLEELDGGMELCPSTVRSRYDRSGIIRRIIIGRAEFSGDLYLIRRLISLPLTTLAVSAARPLRHPSALAQPGF